MFILATNLLKKMFVDNKNYNLLMNFINKLLPKNIFIDR